MNNEISDFGFRISDWEEQRRKNQNLQSAIRTPCIRAFAFMNAGRKTPHSKGFTLIEVLLAMTILAVVLTVIYTSFSTASQNVGQADVRREEADLARTLMARLSADIANAYVKGPPDVSFFLGKKEEVLFDTADNDGKTRHDSISMTTLTNWRKPGSSETELWEVGYFFKEKPEGNGYVLFRREKRELSKDVPPLEGGVEYEISDRVESLAFRYSADGAKFTDEGWDRKTASPKTVEIVLRLDTGQVYVTRVEVGNS